LSATKFIRKRDSIAFCNYSEFSGPFLNEQSSTYCR